MEKSLAELQKLKNVYEKKLGKTKTTKTTTEGNGEKVENRIDI